MDDLEIGPGLVLPKGEIRFHYSRSSGPGGQNVNKVETRVQLRFALARSAVLTERQKSRITEAAGRRMTSEGDLLLSCDMHRERERNRQELYARLRRLILVALTPKKRRVKTRPTRGSNERRLREKRRRAEHKQQRRRPRREE